MRKTRILAVILAFILLLGIVGAILVFIQYEPMNGLVAQRAFDEDFITVFGENYIRNQALVTQNQFMNTIPQDSNGDFIYPDYFAGFNIQNQARALRVHSQFMNTIPQDSNGDFIYPDYFAGFYIDDDGNLVVLYTEERYENASADDFFSPLFAAGVSSRVVEFSYNQLHEVRDHVWSTMRERSESGCIYAQNVVGIGIDRIANRVLVGIIEYNDDMIAGFKKYILDSDMIAFEQSELSVVWR